MAGYEEDTDDVLRWSGNRLKVLSNGSSSGIETPLMKLYTEYKLDMEAEGERPRTLMEFNKRLKKFVKDDTRFIRTRVNGIRTRCVSDVTLESIERGF